MTSTQTVTKKTTSSAPQLEKQMTGNQIRLPDDDRSGERYGGEAIFPSTAPRALVSDALLSAVEGFLYLDHPFSDVVGTIEKTTSTEKLLFSLHGHTAKTGKTIAHDFSRMIDAYAEFLHLKGHEMFQEADDNFGDLFMMPPKNRKKVKVKVIRR